MIKNPEQWSFGMDNDRLIELVLKGKKSATTSIYDRNIPDIGEESILIYENGKQACVVKTIRTIITEFKNITEDMAVLEGEGSYDEWKKIHVDFFMSSYPNFNENTKVLFEIFEVIKIIK